MRRIPCRHSVATSWSLSLLLLTGCGSSKPIAPAQCPDPPAGLLIPADAPEVPTEPEIKGPSGNVVVAEAWVAERRAGNDCRRKLVSLAEWATRLKEPGQ